MALGKSGGQQFPIPHEPGEWMTFQRLGALELDTRTSEGGDLCSDGWAAAKVGERFAIALRWMEAVLVGWSYPEQVTAETRALLDAPTLLWAYVTAVTHQYEAAAAEKKPDLSPSIAISTENPGPDAPTVGV